MIHQQALQLLPAVYGGRNVVASKRPRREGTSLANQRMIHSRYTFSWMDEGRAVDAVKEQRARKKQSRALHINVGPDSPSLFS